MRRSWFDFPVTAAIVAFAVTLTSLHVSGTGSSVVSWLTADKSAIIGGQLWRLFTGPLIHATWGHLLRDLVVVAVIGVAYERPLRPIIGPLALATLAFPAVVVLAAGPQLAGYYGLSGLSHAWIAAALGYELVARRGRRRWYPLVVGLGFAAKLVYEQTGAPTMIPTSLGPGASSAPLAHAAGALVALVVVSSMWSRRPSRRDGQVLGTL